MTLPTSNAAILDQNYQSGLFAIDSTDPTKLVRLVCEPTWELHVEFV